MFGIFNESIFRLRKKYKYVYPELVSANERFDEDGNPIEIHGNFLRKIQSKSEEVIDGIENKVFHDIREYKIEYQLN